MTTRFRCIVLALVSLLALVTSTYAECAWVLWEQATFLKEGKVAELWSIADTAETKARCEERGTEMIRTAYGQSPPGVEIKSGPMWAHETSPGLSKHIQMRCLPDTVDPRGPKTK